MTRKEFDEYVGQDERVDRFAATCSKYGFGTRYMVIGNMAYVDAVIPETRTAISSTPYIHTFTLNLDSDMANILGEEDIARGVTMLEGIIISMNEHEHPVCEFIDDMRTL